MQRVFETSSCKLQASKRKSPFSIENVERVGPEVVRPVPLEVSFIQVRHDGDILKKPLTSSYRFPLALVIALCVLSVLFAPGLTFFVVIALALFGIMTTISFIVTYGTYQMLFHLKLIVVISWDRHDILF